MRVAHVSQVETGVPDVMEVAGELDKGFEGSNKHSSRSQLDPTRTSGVLTTADVSTPHSLVTLLTAIYVADVSASEKAMFWMVRAEWNLLRGSLWQAVSRRSSGRWSRRTVATLSKSL
jgi:hypothetical protein